MKKILVICLVLVTLLLSGCVNARVEYHLFEDHTVTAAYSIAIASDDAQTIGYANTINDYWSSMGFESNVDAAKGQTAIVGEKTHQNSTGKQAADAFAALLIGETSLFDDVKFTYQPDYEHDTFSLNAAVSLEDVIRQSKAQNIPDDELKQLIGKADSGTYTLVISMPGDVQQTNADVTDQIGCTWHLGYGETTNIRLITRLANEQNINKLDALEKQQQDADRWLRICAVAAAVLAAALLITLIVRAVRRNRR